MGGRYGTFSRCLWPIGRRARTGSGARLLWAAAALTLPGLGAVDRRLPIDVGQLPWRALGRVQTELGARCTGVLVGPRTVLTAAHCLYRRGPGAYVQPGSVHFLLGYARGAYAAHAGVLGIRVGPGYDPARETATAGADWAALTLDAPLGTPDRVLKLQRSPPAPGTAVALGGYGQDRAELIDADLGCHVVGLARDREGRLLIRHDCGGPRGTSGAPLLVHGDAGWAVLGLQFAAVPGEAGGWAIAAAALPP